MSRLSKLFELIAESEKSTEKINEIKTSLLNVSSYTNLTEELLRKLKFLELSRKYINKINLLTDNKITSDFNKDISNLFLGIVNEILINGSYDKDFNFYSLRALNKYYSEENYNTIVSDLILDQESKLATSVKKMVELYTNSLDFEKETV